MLFSLRVQICLLSSIEFCVLSVGMMRCVVSVTSLEVVFHKSYVYFSGAAFLTCDGGLVDKR